MQRQIIGPKSKTTRVSLLGASKDEEIDSFVKHKYDERFNDIMTPQTISVLKKKMVKQN